MIYELKYYNKKLFFYSNIKNNISTFIITLIYIF